MDFAIFKNLSRVILYCSFFILILFLYSCSKELNDLPAADRPIPSESISIDRQDFRKLPLEGAHNFRDLGGFKTLDNRSIKWGLLYRSDSLHALSNEDIDYLLRLKLSSIVDFRSTFEREDHPDKLIGNTRMYLLSIDPFKDILPENSDQSFEDLQKEMFSGNLDLSDYLVDFNRDLVSNFTPVYKDFFDTLINNKGLPLVFHCTAGKDRAGFAAALLLSVLGVPRDIVMDDYLATNFYTEDETNKKLFKINLFSLFQADTENIKKVLGVEERYLRAAFNQIDEQWGGMDNYFEKGLMLSKFEIEKIKSLYLE
ncbi:MAG: tyrosine-protein phosphatase [SAR86 cluster bacterium]|jgi:protein-tyrosine phosphatase|nr:tyrosine-protein phosphatase [SAR86 cluster bacterium]